MTRETGSGNPPGREVAGQAASVANYLTTRYVEKKHGGYNLYEDDRIRICLDTYVSNIHIDIPAGESGAWITVLAKSHLDRKPHIFRPGRWTAYLEQLDRRAQEVKANRDAEKKRQQAEDTVRRYGPVDDAAIYADVQ